MLSPRVIVLGYTLMECLIVMASTAIVASLAAPSVTDILQEHDANTSTHTIYRAWQHARQTATNHDQSLILCGSNDGIHCMSQWQKQLILFEDKDNDRIASSEEIVHIYNVDASRGIISSRISFGRTYTALKPDGTSTLTGSFLYCGTQGSELERKITWNIIGRPYYTGNGLDYKSTSSVHCKY